MNPQPMQSPWMDTNQRKNNFNVIRLALATLVIYSHSYPLLYTHDGPEPFFNFTRGQTSGGWLAVNLFFILSGFLITQSWLQSGGLVDYLRKRILRIYPGFIVMSLFCLVIVAPLGSPDPAATVSLYKPANFLLNPILLYVPGFNTVFPANPTPFEMNISAWTIKFEFWCYILIAALGVVGILRRRWAVLAVFLAVLAIYGLQLAGVITDVMPFLPSQAFFVLGEHNNYPRLVSFFLAGSLFYLFRERIPYSLSLFVLSLVAIVVASVLGTGINPVMTIAGTYALFYIVFHRRIQFHDFGKRGDISYGTYLYAFPIQQLLVYYMGTEHLSPVGLFLLATPISYLLGLISWRLVEKPALQLKNFRFKLRSAPAQS